MLMTDSSQNDFVNWSTVTAELLQSTMSSTTGNNDDFVST